MSEISAEQVAHLANLARIPLSDEEIERLTGELGVIVDSVAKVTRGGDPRRAGDQPPDPAAERLPRRRRRRRLLTLDAGAAERPGAADGRGSA